MPRVMKPSALKRLKDTYKSRDLVLPALQRHVMRSIKDDPERSVAHMHPSDMSHKEWCGRHDYYRMVGTPVEKTSQANPSFRMENLFAEGHTIHRKYQTWLWEMGVLYGWWLCHDCENRWEALSPRYCPSCSSPRLEYKEVPLSRSGYLIEGHADGAVHKLEGFTGLIEVKSIGIGTLRFEAPRLYNLYENGNESLDNLWWKINRPFNSHIRQGMLYLWMAWPRYEQIAFIYESKFHQQTKEFVVSYNPSLIAPLLETAKSVTMAVEAGSEPSRPPWVEGPDGKVCGSCSYRRTCWGIQDDAVEQAQASPATAVKVARTTTARRRKQLGPATRLLPA